MDQRKFKCVVVGLYIAHAGEGRGITRPYTETFLLPSQEAALSRICIHLLGPRLQSKHDDYVRFYTHELKSISVEGRQPDPHVLQMGIDEMNVRQLDDFCILRGITIDPNKYNSSVEALGKCKDRISEAWLQKRQESQAREKSGESREQKEIDELLVLNQIEKPPEGVHFNLNEQKILPRKSSGPYHADTEKPEEPKPGDLDMREEAPVDEFSVT